MIKTAKKYLLAFSKEQLKDVSRLLGKAGCFEVASKWAKDGEPLKEIARNLQGAEYRVASLDFAINYLAPLAKKESFLKKLKHPRIAVDKKTREELAKGQGKVLFEKAKRLEEIEKQLSILSREERELSGRLKDLECFGDLDFLPRETSYTVSFLIYSIQSGVEALKEAVEQNGWHLLELSVSSGRNYFVLFGQLSDREGILNALKGLKVETVQYGFELPPLQERKKISKRLEEIAGERAGLEKEIKGFAVDFLKIKIYRDLLAIEKTKLEVRQRAWQNGLMSYLVFWAYDDGMKRLRPKLKKFDPQTIMLGLSLEEGEEPPMVLQNHKLMRPFQYVTEIFGMPRSNELDPTPYLSFFFILFFGICLTDAGYGLVLIAATGFALIFLGKALKDNKLIALLFYGGISTLLMGILFGGYFGAPVSFLEKWPWLLRLKQIDPIEDTVLFMIIAFALGYLQVFFAQIVKIISGTKNKNRSMALSGLGWMFFYLALVLLGATFKWPALKTVSYAVLGAAGLLVIVVESGGVKIFLKPLVGGIKMLQGLIGTMSDVLSYSRLVALGLATGVIALIVNQIAVLLGGMIPYVGFLITGLIMIGGHIFNLGINALGAFIHSGRLQFVEFFPKFLEGGGKRFQPIKAELKYIEA
ncbi:MAG: V-type ATPase 116kDa subunit family protein [Candidatus Pacebacteria bacterium]|nr:V-type ATPase 116kDa subunit family protein [Candidatus Paceibacterota bacterium]